MEEAFGWVSNILHNIFFWLSAGSDCVSETVAHCTVGLEITITAQPGPNFCFQWKAVRYEYQKRQNEKPKRRNVCQVPQFPLSLPLNASFIIKSLSPISINFLSNQWSLAISQYLISKHEGVPAYTSDPDKYSCSYSERNWRERTLQS